MYVLPHDIWQHLPFALIVLSFIIPRIRENSNSYHPSSVIVCSANMEVAGRPAGSTKTPEISCSPRALFAVN
jgi:hypothetical protein